MFKDFKAFLMRGNVVDLAVAVVIGAAFGAIVAAISTGLITPIIGLIIRKDFTKMTFELGASTFNYGIVIDAVIRFVTYAAVIFFLVVKPMQALEDRRRRGEPVSDTPAPSDEALLLTEIRDLLVASQTR
ncbi:MAG: large conductance mechanosensitive channel protein MscL [Acidimicrobiales bacterium]